MSLPITFGELIATEPNKVYTVETNQETGAWTLKNSSNVTVATIADPEQHIVPRSYPFSDYLVSASVTPSSGVTTASTNSLDVSISTSTVRTVGYTDAKLKIVVVSAPGNFSIAGSNVTNGFTYETITLTADYSQNFSKALVFSTAGTYTIKVRLEDANGNLLSETSNINA